MLKVLNAQVNATEATTAKLDAERESLKEQAGTYESDIRGIQTKIDSLQAELSDRSIESFKRGGNQSILAESDPSDSLRNNGLSASVVKSELETAGELRQTKVELVAKEAAKGDLAEKVDLETEQNLKNLRKYESARDALVEVAGEAEKRAGQTLFEAEGLEGVDQTKAGELRKSGTALDQQIGLALADQVEKELAEAKANPDKEYVPDGRFPTDADIVDAGNGIRVHRDIASRVSLMLKMLRRMVSCCKTSTVLAV